MSFPAPSGGWIANENLAAPNSRKPDGSKLNGAIVLENWFPTATGVRTRGGSQKYATIGDGEDPVTAMFTYINGANNKLFATTETDIYDITTVADVDVSPTADVDTLTGGDWSVVQFQTADGTYLRCVNGEDDSQVFDGSAWGTSPAITGVSSDTLSFVWQFKQRLFFVEKDSLNAWYLAVAGLGGSATKLPLGAIFTRGGSLLFGASWSLDENSGLSASCVFVTTEGEVAVYKGSNPGDADDWALVGVYRIGKPMGKNAFIRAGGDLVIATDAGFVPLSAAIARDFAALAPSAVSYPIETAWNEAVGSRRFAPWTAEIWPTKQMALITLPTQEGLEKIMFAANVRTGAWARYKGWLGTCLRLFGDRLFYGSIDGKVIEAEVTGADDGFPYTCTCIPLFDSLKYPASVKSGLQARAVYQAHVKYNIKLSLQRDYNLNLPTAPDDTSVILDDLWGTGEWGSSSWALPPNKSTFMGWQSVPGSGYALSVAAQITSGSIVSPSVDLVQIDFTYDKGEVGS